MKHEHSSYGNFLGGDPRRFSPDTESQTPEEAEAYKRDCEAWDRGERPEQLPPTVAVPITDEAGKVTGTVRICRASYGLGVTTWDCDDPECPDADEPIDPEDANAAFERWHSFDAEVLLHDEKDDAARLRVAFLAGFRAREEIRNSTPSGKNTSESPKPSPSTRRDSRKGPKCPLTRWA